MNHDLNFLRHGEKSVGGSHIPGISRSQHDAARSNRSSIEKNADVVDFLQKLPPDNKVRIIKKKYAKIIIIISRPHALTFFKDVWWTWKGKIMQCWI
jgi:hypothetical protein